MNRTLFRLPQLLLPLAAAGCWPPVPVVRRPRRTRTPRLQRLSVYAGPRPASADVQAFEVNLWVNINRHRAAAAVTRPAASRRCSRARTTSTRPTAPRSRWSICRSRISRRWWSEGRRRPQLLALEPSGLRRHSDHLDQNWAGGGSGGAAGSTQIQLTAPVDQTVGATKLFPADPTLFSQHGLSGGDAVLLALPFRRARPCRSRRTSPAAILRRRT